MILNQSGCSLFCFSVATVDPVCSQEYLQNEKENPHLFIHFPPVFHMAPPSTPADFQYSSAPLHISPAPFPSLPSYSLQDKHRKLREHQGVCGFLSSAPSLSLTSSLSPDSHPSHCHEDDLTKPKGKRPYKTKHTEGETGQEEIEGGGAEDEEIQMVRKIYIHKPTEKFDSTQLVTVRF